MTGTHDAEMRYLMELQGRLPYLTGSAHWAERRMVKKEIAFMEARLGVSGTLLAQAKPYEVFQESAVTSTTIDIGISLFTLALVFPIMQTAEGRKLIREILAKAVPSGCTLSEDAVLTTVKAQDTMMQFTFFAEHKMLRVPNPNSMPSMENFTLDTTERNTRPSQDAQKASQTLNGSFQGILDQLNLYNVPLAPHTTSGKSMTPPPYAQYATVDTKDIVPEAPPAVAHGKALDLLCGSETVTLSNGTHILYRTPLGSFHLYKATDDDEPGEKLYVAVDIPDLRGAITRLRSEAEMDAIKKGEACDFSCDIDRADWYTI